LLAGFQCSLTTTLYKTKQNTIISMATEAASKEAGDQASEQANKLSMNLMF
jgi:hypothetical protein